MMPGMEFQDVVRTRRMVRRYDDRAVDPAVVNRMLTNAIHAPSAGFSQGWSFLVLDQRADLDLFWSACADPDRSDGPDDGWLRGMRTAPLVVVPLSNKDAYLDRYAEADKGWADRDESRWPVPYWHIDTGMAALLILQTAVDEGLGACFFGIPGRTTGAFRDAFAVPETWTPIGAITVGHRVADTGVAGSPARRARKPVEEAVHRGRW
jgi:nitroreductase